MDRIKNIILKLICKYIKTSTQSQETSRSFYLDKKRRLFLYKVSPICIYINNNIDQLLLKSRLWFKRKKIKLKIGIEIEFFSNIDFDTLEKEINKFSKENNINLSGFDKERGNKQYEIKFLPYTNIAKLIRDYNKLKNFLENNFNCDFNSITENDVVGSALQINISLFKNNKNLFLQDKKTILYNSIAGILSTINMFLEIYTKDLVRYDKNINSLLYEKGKIPAPSYIAWGYNNRTCAIRIPDSKVISNNLEEYKKEIEESKRIEFRVPSSESNIKFVLYVVMNSIIYGIVNNIKPPEHTYNNTFKDHNNLEEIHQKYYDFSDYYEIVKSMD